MVLREARGTEMNLGFKLFAMLGVIESFVSDPGILCILSASMKLLESKLTCWLTSRVNPRTFMVRDSCMLVQ